MSTRKQHGHRAAILLVSFCAAGSAALFAPTAPAQSKGPVVAPISSEGVRGDVLLAMLNQNHCRQKNYAAAVSHDGAILADQRSTGAPKIMAHTYLQGATKTYLGDPNLHFRITPDLDTLNCSQRYHFPATPGVHQYVIGSKSDYTNFRSPPDFGAPWLKRGFNHVELSFTVIVREDWFGIGRSNKLAITEDLGYKRQKEGPDIKGKEERPWMAAESIRMFRRDQRVPFDTIQQWHSLRMFIAKGDTRSEAKLCMHVEQKLLKRLQCNSWKIPADYRWGDDLSSTGGYIIDDRSVYPGESGFLYWRSRGG